jgi:hypothetical protein
MDWGSLAAIAALLGLQSFWIKHSLDALGKRITDLGEQLGARITEQGQHLGKRLDDLTARMAALEHERTPDG